MRSQYDVIVGLIYYSSLMDSFLQPSQIVRYLMFSPLLKDLETIGTYNWGSTCLAWLYKELCRASHINIHDISGPLITLQLWI